MGLFDFFKKKKAQNALNEMVDKVRNQAFPGGNEQILSLVNQQYEYFNHKYTKEVLFQAINYMGVGLAMFEDKSAHRIVDIGMKPKNLLSQEDALELYKSVVRNFFESRFGKNEVGYKAFYQSLGNIEGAMTGDEMPGAFGAYGTETSNPIPINGVSNSYSYLNRLRLANGQKVKYERIGTFSSEITDEIIDGYVLYTEDGKDLTTIFICPYVNANPKKAPDGFILT